MNFFKNNTYKEYSIFFWVVLISILGIFSYTIYLKNKQEEANQIIGGLDNIYLKKTVKEITNSLKPRYNTIYYISKSGDTYENIINNLNINNNEKINLLKTIL